MTLRKMLDSTNPYDIPHSADLDLVGGYTDGLYADLRELRARFPHKVIVAISATGRVDCNVYDVERGDLTPGQGAAKAKERLAHGHHPTLYTSFGEWPAVEAAVKAAGIAGRVSYWIADYDGKAEIPAEWVKRGCVAKQYLGSPGNSPGHYDASVVLSYWPGIDAPTAEHPLAPAWFHRPLKLAKPFLHGADVHALQARLRFAGHDLDGIFGPKTERAVKSFQHAHDLRVTGVVDSHTAIKLAH